MASPLSFRLLERYDVIEEIGQGGHAIVYRATDQSLGRDVAVKILREDVLLPDIRARFTQEIQLLARLQHPHILRVHDSGTHGDRPFVVMELAPSQTLAHRLEREPQLPLSDAVQITRDVGSALAHAHDRAVWHRDVKPENILLGDGGAVLADFGIARVTGEMAISRITNTGESVGTVLYMSPEQLCAESVDARSDQYSLACVLYEMLAGVRPHTAATFEGLRALRLTARQAPVSVYRPSVSPALEEVVHRAMAVTPADRFRSMDEFLMALDLTRTGDRPISAAMPTPVSGGIAGSGPLRAEAPAARSPARPRWWLPALVGVGVLGGAWWVTGTGARRANADAGAGPGLLTVAIAEAVDPMTDSVRARVAREVAAWSGVRIVSGPDASVQLAVTTTALGDSVQLRLESRSSGGRLEVSRMLARAALPTADATIAALTREALAGRAASEVPGLDGLPERSLPALRAYVRGHGLLRAGQLDSAAQAFREARDTLPRFAQARFWAAQSAAWSTPRAVDRWKSDADEAVRIGTLRGVDSLLAVGLARMGAMEFVAACGAYRAATRADASQFVGWYGLGRCQQLDSLVVSEAGGLRFRASHWSVLAAYRNVVDRTPSSGLLAAIYLPIERASYGDGNSMRAGVSADRKTRYFALPSLAADTLAFVPDVAERFEGGQGRRIPSTLVAAIRTGRAYGLSLTDRWTMRFPTAPEAWLQHATSLELVGRVATERPLSGQPTNADAALDRVASSANLDVMIKAGVARVRLALRRGDLLAAADTAGLVLDRTEGRPLTGSQRAQLAPLALLIGARERFDRLASTVALEDTSAAAPMRAPLHRLDLAVLFGDCADVANQADAVEEQLTRSIASASRDRERSRLLAPRLRLGIDCLDAGRIRSLPVRLPLDSVYYRLAMGDRIGARRMLDVLRSQRLAATGASLTWDYLYDEAWALTVAGDSAAARNLLVGALSDLSSMPLSTLSEVRLASGLRRSLLLLPRLSNDGGGNTVAAWLRQARAFTSHPQ